VCGIAPSAALDSRIADGTRLGGLTAGPGPSELGERGVTRICEPEGTAFMAAPSACISAAAGAGPFAREPGRRWSLDGCLKDCILV